MHLPKPDISVDTNYQLASSIMPLIRVMISLMMASEPGRSTGIR